jgi:orf45
VKHKDLTIATIILLVSLAINMLSVYYVLTVPRRVETVSIHKVDNVGAEMHGKVAGKSMVGKLYTLDCGAYGKFLVSKEQYDSVQVGDDIPSYLKGRGQ